MKIIKNLKPTIMKNYLSILTATMLIVFVSCQTQPQQSPEDYQKEVKQKIAELNKLWFEAWENEDLDAVMTVLDDSYLHMFGFNLTWNKEECREHFQEGFDTHSIEDVEYKTVETVVDQNYAFEILLFKQKRISNDKQDTIYYDMRFMTVYKKQSDDNWKVFRMIAQR
jgi:ketosteroid isomerase-like protein